MKSNQVTQLKELIRGMVRQEVKSAVQEEVSKAMGKVLVEMVKEIKKPAPKVVVTESVENVDSVEEAPEEPMVRAPKVAVIKTNNPKLNSVLAETARNFRGLPRQENSLAELMGGDFNKVGDGDESVYEAPTSNIGYMKQIISENTTQGGTPSVLDAKSELPSHLQKLFSGKNLGAILKKSKEPGAGSGVSLG